MPCKIEESDLISKNRQRIINIWPNFLLHHQQMEVELEILREVADNYLCIIEDNLDTSMIEDLPRIPNKTQSISWKQL